ncbi:MAG: hypothetical protein NTV53_01450 [Actinobacteria bacterium]|nr:hypothetical protein [Actinomycetota bacterium]
MNESRAKRASQIWLVLVLLWAMARAVFVNKLFGSHGVNGLIYLAVDLASSVPYAIYSARLVITFINHDFKNVYKNILLTSLFFYIPDVYILIAARRVPSGLYLILFLTIALFSAFAIATIARDIRNKRRTAHGGAENSR